MDDEVVWMVRCKTRTACQREFDWLRAHRDVIAGRPPTDAIGPGWVARAVLRDTGDEPAET